MTTAALAQRRLPVLKLPDPAFTLGRLVAGLGAGLLSRVHRTERVGVDQVVANEAKDGNGAGPPALWGIVRMGAGEPVQSLEALAAERRAGLDAPTLEEFRGEEDFFYHPLELVERFAPPRPLERPVPGRRFAGDVDVDVDVDTEKRAIWASPGGKHYLVKTLLPLFPPHRVYVEPFAGSAALLFAKEPAEVEVVNDLNPEIAHAFRFVRDCTPEQLAQLKRLKWTGDREYFVGLNHGDIPADPVRRFHRFAYLTRFGFNRTIQPSDTLSYSQVGLVAGTVRLVEEKAGRLKGVKVRSADYERVIREFDGPNTFFFIDPPYRGYDAAIGNAEFDEERLVKVLRSIKGKFLTTYGTRHPKALFMGEGFHQRVVEHRGGGGPGAPTVRTTTTLISNYPLPRAVAKLSQEDVVNAHLLVLAELERRRLTHRSRDDALEALTADLLRRRTAADGYAPIHASGEVQGREVTLEEVLGHLKSFALRQPLLYLVGGLVNHGRTRNDIDILVKGKLTDELRHVLHFRLGRMLPLELARRVQLLDDDFDGPFTRNVPLGDLVFRAYDHHEVKVMQAEAEPATGGDPLLELPAERGPRRGVLQLHFRGRSVHGDLRFDRGPNLVGWTLAWQRPGVVPDVNTLAQARDVARGLAVGGSKFFKPLLAPAKLQAFPKAAQPQVWLGVEGVVEPGKIGATAEEEGVFLIVDQPRVEWGMQQPFFHEYFLSGKLLAGVLHVRRLEAERIGEGELEPGEERLLWTAWMSKELLPSVLKRRAVEQRRMPPDGQSALPVSLERAVPREFRYWEKAGEAARLARDELVASRYFTPQNVRLVDGEWRRVEEVRRFSLGGEGEGEEFLRQRAVPFVLHWQFWRGPQVVRGGVTRQLWRLILDRGAEGVEWWELDRDPLTTPRVTALHFRSQNRALLAASGDQPPGSALNPTKATPSGVEVLDEGEAFLFEDSRTFKKIRFKGQALAGLHTLQPEDPAEPASRIWLWERGEVPQAKDAHEPLGPGYEALEAAEVGEGVRPGLKFQPLKPKGPPHKSPEELIEAWLQDAFLKEGVAVEPKFNGFRTVLSRGGEGTLIYFEDAKQDRSAVMPGVARELASLPDVVLDAELQVVTEGEVEPRRALGRFSGAVGAQDDAGVRMQVFDALYWRGKDLSLEPWSRRQEALDEVFEEARRLGLRHFARVEPQVVKTREALLAAMDRAKQAPGSEGAMAKWVGSTYTLAGATDSWAKWKAVRVVAALALKKRPVRGAPRTFNYTGGVGPVSEDEAAGWKNEKRQHGGRTYLVIGQTGNTNEPVEVGQVFEAEVLELRYDERDPGAKELTWFGPAQVAGVLTGRALPDSVPDVLALAQPQEIQRREHPVRLLKGREERFVLGIVLVPEEPDSQGDIYSHEEVERAAHWWAEHGRFQTGLMHQRRLSDDQVRVLESGIARSGFTYEEQLVKQGTWFLAVRILDAALWDRVKVGRLTGYSIGGLAAVLAEIRKARQVAQA